MDDIKFSFDYSQLDFVRLFQEDKISPEEIEYVFRFSEKLYQSGNSGLKETIFIQIGYTFKKRIIMIAFIFPNENIEFIGAKVADEDEIIKYFCISK